MQCRPIVTYSLATVLVLWILLGAITLPNANRWLKGFGSSIEQDRVSFRLDQPFDMHHAIVEKESHQSYHYNVFPITNTPHLPTHGLDGVLYDKGDACLQTTAVPNLNTSYANMSKVALIQQSSACYLVDKIHHAEIDGALAVIVFHNDPNVLHSSLADMGVMPKKVNIPSYYIDYSTGVALLNNIYNLSHQPQQEGYSPSMVHVQLVPGKKPVLDHWQFGLVIVGIMLLTCIFTVAMLQCHMWRMTRLGRHQHTSHETLTLEDQHQLEMNESFWRNIMDDIPPPPPPPPPLTQKQRLEQSLVDLLPTRTFKKKTSSVESLSHHCVICLDGFEQGHVLRRLPCQHEYHRDCIDTWLTRKNNTCPLCLQRIEIPTVPEQAHPAMPDLVQTWQHLEQASVRQYHSRSYSRP